jgi:hypothetical protein
MAAASSAQLQGIAPTVFSCAIPLVVIAATGSHPLMATVSAKLVLRVLESAEDDVMPVDVFPQNVGMRRSCLFPRPEELLKFVSLALNHFAEFRIPLRIGSFDHSSLVLSLVLTRPPVHPPRGR